MSRPAAIALVAGCALIVAAFAAVDWRLGLGMAGLLLIVSTVDVTPRKRA